MEFPSKLHVTKTLGALVNLLPETDRTKPQILLLAGAVTPYRNDTDREMPFRQESNFYYLTGCGVPSSYLLVHYQAGTSVEKTPTIDLFIPKAEPADIMWSVPPPDLETATSTFAQATNVSYTSDLPSSLSNLINAYPDALVHTLPLRSPKFPEINQEFLALAPNNTTDEYLLSGLARARITKTPYEITQIRLANEISSRAHEVVMRVLGSAVKGLITAGPGAGVTRPLLPGEWLIEKEEEAEAVFVASCRREGAVHQAYLPIVAASTRASTLHYCCNDKEFAWGPLKRHDHPESLVHTNGRAPGERKEFIPQVLLIDAGCEWNCYASDITRTMPIGNGGKFATEARHIYDLVLEMQKASMQILKPGLHWDAVQLLCHRILVKRFQELGIFLSPSSPGSGSWNSEEAILASGVGSAFFPHGVGHSLGLDVHDVPSVSRPAVNDSLGNAVELGNDAFYVYLRLRLPLETGMVVTVEPGVYFSPHLLAGVRNSKHINHDVLARYEHVGGVRIEDVVLITEDGCENLTTVGKETSWVEGVCSGEI